VFQPENVSACPVLFSFESNPFMTVESTVGQGNPLMPLDLLLLP